MSFTGKKNNKHQDVQRDSLLAWELKGTFYFFCMFFSSFHISYIGQAFRTENQLILTL